MKKPFSALQGLFIENVLTCRDVAISVGLSPQTMSSKMQGKSFFTVAEMLKIGRQFNLTPEEYTKYFYVPTGKILGGKYQ